MSEAAASVSERVAGLRSLARVLDSAFQVPGTSIRIGVDGLLGLVPVGGDLVGAALSGYVVLAAARLGVPRLVLARMLLNVGIDTLVGAVPLVGDLFDVGWRANTRNVALIERALATPSSLERSSGALLVAVALAIVVSSAALVAAGVWSVRWLFAQLS